MRMRTNNFINMAERMNISEYIYIIVVWRPLHLLYRQLKSRQLAIQIQIIIKSANLKSNTN